LNLALSPVPIRRSRAKFFHKKYPEIKLQEIYMNEGVKFMVERAKNEADRGK